MTVITNIVVQSSLNVNIKLNELIRDISDAKYQPSRFSAICWNLRKIPGTCLLFNNGCIIGQGCKTMVQARKSLRQYARVVQKRGYAVRLSPIRLITASALGDIDTTVNLNAMRSWISGSTYEPEIFNALTFKRHSMHFSLFASGKVVITGIKNFTLINTRIPEMLLELAITL